MWNVCLLRKITRINKEKSVMLKIFEIKYERSPSGTRVFLPSYEELENEIRKRATDMKTNYGLHFEPKFQAYEIKEIMPDECEDGLRSPVRKPIQTEKTLVWNGYQLCGKAISAK
jgi:hypothetical protein